MKHALAIIAGLALAIVGTIAIGGTSYAPPVSSGSGSGVSGDGTGITDASAFRSSLGLGTAATASTGTSMGNVVVLGMGATLPVVNGQNLTGLSSSQISGLGTAAGYSAGSFQASDSELSAIAGLTSSADQLPYFTGSGTAALASFSTAGRALIDDADAAAQRTTLGLGTAATTASTAYQAADSELSAIAGLTSAADSVPYFTGSGTAALATLTTAGRGLLDDATAADMRTTLGLGTAATTAAAWPDDAWGWTWTAANGLTGWTLADAQSRVSITTVSGKSAMLIADGTGSATATTAKYSSGVGGSDVLIGAEYRYNYWQEAAAAASNPNYYASYTVGGRFWQFEWTATNINTQTTNAWKIPETLLGNWVTITVRIRPTTTTSSSALEAELWLGEYFIGTAAASSFATYAGNGEVWLANASTGSTNTKANAISWFRVRNGLNSTPPDIRYHGLGLAGSATE